MGIQEATRLASRDDYVARAVEVSIDVGLLILLSAACLLILRPFLPLVAWGVIIAVAVYPSCRKLQDVLKGRRRLAVVICTALLLIAVIVPVALLAGSLVSGVQGVASRLKNGTLTMPALPSRIEAWPIIGGRLKNAWEMASQDLSTVLRTFAPQIKVVISQLLMASAGIGLAVLQWIFSIIIAGILLAYAPVGTRIVHLLANRLFGEKGEFFATLAAATIRSVTTGIIGVALIQSFFAALGFAVARLPGAGFWAAIFLCAAILQVGGIVLIPAAIYMFAIASTAKAVAFVVWCVIVGVMDNVLKPLLLARGVKVPMPVVFLGAIGGFVSMGAIGMFVGAILLSVGYTLVLAWLAESVEVTRTTRS